MCYSILTIFIPDYSNKTCHHIYDFQRLNDKYLDNYFLVRESCENATSMDPGYKFNWFWQSYDWGRPLPNNPFLWNILI